eukprot:COSAG02_NODE_8733_length_2460_cov_1.407031_4_plen_78_part_00
MGRKATGPTTTPDIDGCNWLNTKLVNCVANRHNKTKLILGKGNRTKAQANKTGIEEKIEVCCDINCFKLMVYILNCF